MSGVFRIVIAGSRAFDDYGLLQEKMDHLTQNLEHITVVSGTARGADTLGERWAKKRGHGIERYPAKWDEHGRRAGYIRNEEMARVTDAVVVFWDGVSRGSEHMIDLVRDTAMPLRIVRFHRKETQ